MKKFLARIRLAIQQRRVDRAIANADRINNDRRQKQRRAPGRAERDKYFRRDQVRLG